MRIAANCMRDSVASGCTGNYRGRKLVLSASHATGNGDNWAAELKHVQGRGTELYRFGNINFLTEHNIVDGTGEDVDFSYSQVPADFGAWFQVLDPSGVVQHEEPRAEFDFARYAPDPHQRSEERRVGKEGVS